MFLRSRISFQVYSLTFHLLGYGRLSIVLQERFRPSSIFVSLRLIDLSLRIFVSTPRVRCRSPGRGGIDLHASSTNDRPFSLLVAFHPVVTRSLIGSVILYEGIRVHSNSRALTVHDHEKVNETAASLEHHFDIEARARHLSLSKFLDLLRESFGRSQRVSVRLSVCLSPSRRWNTRFSIDIACCIAARFAFHLQDGSERRNRERHRKLTVIAFNVTRARTDQSQLLEVTESRGRRRNQLLSGFWWSGRVREPLFAKIYGGMFLSFVRPRRGFREDNDDLKRKKKKEKGFGFCESLYPYKWK